MKDNYKNDDKEFIQQYRLNEKELAKETEILNKMVAECMKSGKSLGADRDILRQNSKVNNLLLTKQDMQKMLGDMEK